LRYAAQGEGRGGHVSGDGQASIHRQSTGKSLCRQEQHRSHRNETESFHETFSILAFLANSGTRNRNKPLAPFAVSFAQTGRLRSLRIKASVWQVGFYARNSAIARKSGCQTVYRIRVRDLVVDIYRVWTNFLI
jgi:hypothetical protein